MTRALLACTLLHAAATAPKPIQLLTVPRLPAYVTPGSSIRVQVRLQPEADDRGISVVVDGPDYYGRSDWAINGAESPRLYPPIWFIGLPPGEYQIIAIVWTATRERARDTKALTVIAP